MLPTILPAVPPLPSCSVPAEIVVPPVKVLSAVSTVVPVPARVSAPAPEMTPESVTRIAAIDHEHAVIRDVASDTARGAAVAELQCAAWIDQNRSPKPGLFPVKINSPL